MTETENPTPNPDFEAAVQEKLRQEQEANNADPVIVLPEDSVVATEDVPPEGDETVTGEEPEVTNEEEPEKDVQAQHQNILTPEHYLGSEKVNPDNPMLEHMKPEDYDSNKNKENR